MRARREAREWAVQILFQTDFNPGDIQAAFNDFWNEKEPSPHARKFAEELVLGTVQNMEKINDLAVEKGVRDKLLLIAGGTQVTDELAKAWGMDAGFGRGTHGHDVASFMVEALRDAPRTRAPKTCSP